MRIIETKHLRKQFGEHVVLKDVSIHVEEGEIFGLLGPSGSGKTTLIRSLLGIWQRDGGEASLLGRDCNHLDNDSYALIGMLLDEQGLFDRLSCTDNLDIYRRIYGLSKDAVTQALAMTGLTDARKTPVLKLSKGMKQRLAFARAVLHKPKLLFLDEPTSGLDPATSLRIHAQLKELQKQGVTIFLTTHDMEEAASLCNRVAFLHEGTILVCDTPQNICCTYHYQPTLHIATKDHEEIMIQDMRKQAREVEVLLASGKVLSMHTNEPTLGKVFVEMTGKELV